MDYLYKREILILEIFSGNSLLGPRFKMPNNEKKNLECKLHFLSVSLTHFKVIFHLLFFTSSVTCLQSKSGQKDLIKHFELTLS